MLEELLTMLPTIDFPTIVSIFLLVEYKKHLKDMTKALNSLRVLIKLNMKNPIVEEE